LKVKVSGEGFVVRSRTGFYVAPKAPERRRQGLVNALASVVQYTGMRLTARLRSVESAGGQPASGTGQTRSVEFQLGIIGDSITVDRARDNAVDLEIASVAFDGKRKGVASSSQLLATALKPELLQKIPQTGLGLPQKAGFASGEK